MMDNEADMATKSNSPQVDFSVIIPVYNAEKTIARAVESVLAQSFKSFEIIIVDDASNDKSANIISDGYKERVKYIRRAQNGGGSIARNSGLDNATGRYIAFLDADDIWHPDKLLLVHTILSSLPKITLLFHPFTKEDIHSVQINENIKVFKLPFIKLLPANIIAPSCAIMHNNPSFRFETSMRYTEDYDLWLRIGYRHKIYFIESPLTQVFRDFLSKGGVSEKKWKMRKGEMKAYLRLTKLNPLFVLLLPFLLSSSIFKYAYKGLMKR